MAKKSAYIERPTVAKCKRIVRPLLSKIHALTDLYAKYPSRFTFDIHLFTTAKVDGGNLRFTHPASANDRLQLLQPFISADLYCAYVEIYAMFRNVIGAICDHQQQTGRVSRLTTLASLSVGKTVALGTKSTFWQLNQSMLFEPGTLPPHLQKYHLELSDDIDDWLQLEPAQVSHAYRNDILLGYVLHILVLNLRALLYLLVPVLVHWLNEQESVMLANVLRTLFMEYWLFLPHAPEYRDTFALSSAIVCPAEDPSVPVFWLLHRIGFWRHMVQELAISSSFASLATFDTYEGLVLDSLARTTWLLLSQVKPPQVYDLLNNNVQNPNNTNIIILVISQQIESLTAGLKSTTSAHGTFRLLNSAYANVRLLVQTWLRFDNNCLFNSLDKGNHELFGAVFVLLRYSQRKCAPIIGYLEKNWQTTRLSKVRELLHKFKFIHYHVGNMVALCDVLRSYYLDLGTELAVDARKVASMAEFLADLMGDHSLESAMANFLLWVYGKGTTELKQLARSCFEHLYMEDSWLASRDLEHVHYILYESVEEPSRKGKDKGNHKNRE